MIIHGLFYNQHSVASFAAYIIAIKFTPTAKIKFGCSVYKGLGFEATSTSHVYIF